MYHDIFLVMCTLIEQLFCDFDDELSQIDSSNILNVLCTAIADSRWWVIQKWVSQRLFFTFSAMSRTITGRHR